MQMSWLQLFWNTQDVSNQCGRCLHAFKFEIKLENEQVQINLCYGHRPDRYVFNAWVRCRNTDEVRGVVSVLTAHLSRNIMAAVYKYIETSLECDCVTVTANTWFHLISSSTHQLLTWVQHNSCLLLVLTRLTVWLPLLRLLLCFPLFFSTYVFFCAPGALTNTGTGVPVGGGVSVQGSGSQSIQAKPRVQSCTAEIAELSLTHTRTHHGSIEIPQCVWPQLNPCWILHDAIETKPCGFGETFI